MKIPITKPYFGPEEHEALKTPLETGWVTQGPKVREFEGLFARFMGDGHAVSCSSGTAALHLALAALGIGPGDEVIVPSFTFVATANAVEYVGARPLFVDIDLDTFNISVDGVERAVGPRTKAIMPVHQFGLAAEMRPLLALAKRRGLIVIEDAACAVGSRYKERPVGGLGDIGCFSFHPRKVITTGEGGMVVTRRAETAERLVSLRNHGASLPDRRKSKEETFSLPAYDLLGYNYRMSDLQAAVGAVQLGRLDWLISERRRRARRYTTALSAVPGIRLPSEPEGCLHIYQSYVILLTEEAGVSRDELAVRLAKKGIDTRQGTHAVHALGYYAKKYGLRPGDCPNALAADQRSLTLPLYPQMTDEEQDFVIDGLLRQLSAKRSAGKK